MAELGRGTEASWVVESSWLRSSLIRTEYAFDGAPDVGHARFGG